MSASPSLLLVGLLSITGVLAIVVVLLALVWTRVRALPLAEAQRLVAELTELQREAQGLMARVDSRASDPSAAPSSESPNVSRMRGTTKSRVDPPASPVAGPTLIAIPSLAAPPSETTAAAAVELGRRFGAIWDLADSGASTEAIARRSGQPIGQVELILALRRQLAVKSGDRS